MVHLRSQPPGRAGTGPARHHRLRDRARSGRPPVLPLDARRLLRLLATRGQLRGGDSAGTAAEAFPHACTVFLAGRPRQPDEDKVSFRRHVLRHLGVDAAALTSADRVDAALAALTGLLALGGAREEVGDPQEGVILLPARATRCLPGTTCPAPHKRQPDRASVDLCAAGRCGCGCGAPVRRRFLPAMTPSSSPASWPPGERVTSPAAERLRALGWLAD